MVLIGSETRHKRNRTRKLKWIRSLYIRDGRLCFYCGREMLTMDEIEGYRHVPGLRLPDSYPTLDHVTPRSQGGRTVLENLVIACKACNQHKGNQLTYIARQQREYVVTPVLGICPECKDPGSDRCWICRGAGTLDTQRYFEITEKFSDMIKRLQKKTREKQSRIRQLELVLSEHEDKSSYHKSRKQLLGTISNLTETIAQQAERIRELGGGRVQQNL